MKKIHLLFLSLVTLHTSQPLHATPWRKVATYTAGALAIGSCAVGAYYLWKQYTKPCEPVPVQPCWDFKKQIETHFSNFECLIKNSQDDLKYVIAINHMIDELEKDEISIELLCTVLRHKKPVTGETLFALASQSTNPVTRIKFEQLYNYYAISTESHKK